MPEASHNGGIQNSGIEVVPNDLIAGHNYQKIDQLVGDVNRTNVNNVPRETLIRPSQKRIKKVKRDRAKRSHTSGELISTENVQKSRRKQHLGQKSLSSPTIEVQHELTEISDSDIELGCSAVESFRIQRISQDEPLVSIISQVSTDVDLTQLRSVVDGKAISPVIPPLQIGIVPSSPVNDTSPQDVPPVSHFSNLSLENTQLLKKLPLLPNSVINISTPHPSAKHPKGKSLAEICATTSSSYFKPRVGLSRRSRITSLHRYLTKPSNHL